MIIRARPKYLDSVRLARCFSNTEDSKFYFNTGRAALKFLLLYLRSIEKKMLVVGMQAFNCNVVYDAVKESGNGIVLCDIELDTFSISYETVKKLVLDEKIDILLLTHYQGIPNRDYLQIIEICRNHKVVVIEDVSQTYGSVYKGHKVGSLGDYAIESYAFDKPITSLYGGAVTFNAPVSSMFLSLYEELKNESKRTCDKHLHILSYLLKYTAEDKYKVGIDRSDLLSFINVLGLSDEMIYFLLSCKGTRFFITKIYSICKMLFFNNSIRILRLHPKKVMLIKEQKVRYSYDNSCVESFQGVIKKCGINIPELNGSIIHWNRLSVLDENGNLKKILVNKGYQVSNFNWPIILSHDCSNRKIRVMGKLPNSVYASKKILNIPVWKSYE